MKKVIAGIFIGLLTLTMMGCTTAAKTIGHKMQNGQAGIFMETKDIGTPAQGVSVLTIKATIKTHLKSYYLFESQDSVHGNREYPFMINIDGQPRMWTVTGQEENLPLYDKDGKTSRDPDSGEGIKYFLEKKIKLRAGTHKIFFGLPADDYFKEIDVTVKEGEINYLEYRPIYKYKTIPARIPNFKKGVKEYEVYLNNRRI